MLGRGDEYVGGDRASMKLAARALEKMRKEERGRKRDMDGRDAGVEEQSAPAE
jgi:hypothetical protein